MDIVMVFVSTLSGSGSGSSTFKILDNELVISAIGDDGHNQQHAGS
jgi:hypothetical protein